MKSYNEMASCVFERRDRYNAARAAAKRRMQKITAGAVCCCLVAVLGFGVMRDHQIPVAPAPDHPEVPEQTDISDLQTGPSSHNFPFQEMVSTEINKWKTAEEILESDDNVSMGVSVPSFLSYRGGFYANISDGKSKIEGCALPDKVWFNPEYQYTAYQIKNYPDHFAIAINGGLMIYQKIFDVTFELEGVIYGIQYSPSTGSECTPGPKILSDGDFTVYEMTEEGKYLVNILPLLQRYRPNLFGGEENYKEAWQIALPLGKTVTDIPVADVPGSTGALIPYEEVWGGSYTDAQGNQVVLLTENTPENQQEVFRRNPALNVETTVFQTADFSLAYLTGLLADISKAMGDGSLSFVPTAGLYEDRNRVVVTITTDDPGSIAQVLAFDILGGAIEIRQTSGQNTTDHLIMNKNSPLP